MENIYFLLVVAVCAAAIVGFVVRMERKRRLTAQARRKQAHSKAHLQPRRDSGTYRHIHGHASSEVAPKVEVWNSLHKRTRDEDRVEPPISATRLYSDDEVHKDDLASELKMRSVEYTPEELTRRSTPR